MDILELFILLLVFAWVAILPIALPIVFGLRYRRIRRALLDLYNNGELTRAQYIQCVGTTPPKESEKSAHAKSLKTEAPEVRENAEESEGSEIQKGESLGEPAVVSSPLMPIPVLLSIGVVLLCTAGAAYISSIWGTASDIAKLISVGSFGLIFFAAFWLSHYRLQIVSSAKAFFILGVAAVGITVTAAQRFGLILPDIQLSAQMLLPTAIIAAGMFGGYPIFKSKLFPVLTTLFVFLFLTAFSATIFDDHAMMFFIPGIVSTAAYVWAVQSQKALAIKARKPASVILLLFVCLLFLSTFALDHTLYNLLMAAFGLTLVILMHIHLHHTHGRMVEFAIPIALCWTMLSFFHTLPTDSESIQCFIGCILIPISATAIYFATRRHGQSPHPITLVLSAIAIIIIALETVLDGLYKTSAALFIPALTFMMLGAHLMKRARTNAIRPETTITQAPQKALETSTTGEQRQILENSTTDAPQKALETSTTEEQRQASDAAKAPLPPQRTCLQFIAPLTAQCIGGIYTLIGYLLTLELTVPQYTFEECPEPPEPCLSEVKYRLMDLQSWQFNLVMSLALLAIALIPERSWSGDSRSRRYTSFVLMILMALCQLRSYERCDGSYYPFTLFLCDYPFHQILFLVPAFALAVIESKNSYQNNRPKFHLTSQIFATSIILWVARLLLEIAETILNGNRPWHLRYHLTSEYTFVLVALILAAILIFKPKIPYRWVATIAFGLTAAYTIIQSTVLTICLILGLNLLQCLRNRVQSDHDRTISTISNAIIAIALTIEIGSLPNNSWLPAIIRPELTGLIPLSAAYLITWRIWKFRYPSHRIASTLALIVLPLIYIVPNDNVQFHAITVTILAIAAILVAIRTKRSRYLAIGTVSIAIIFFSQTQNFWNSLHWWIYLAIVGVILLTIAVANETQRRKGSTIIQEAKGLISRAWKW